MSTDEQGRYAPSEVEAKWQREWEERGTNAFSREDLESAEEPYYNLMMFPYPSAEGLHVGNMYAFTGADVHGRFQRLTGKTVFEPIGFDAFGLALFAVLGAQKALAQGAPGVIAVVMGVLTGAAGGMIRDVLSGEIPLVLQREIYATAAFAGALVLVVLREVGMAMEPAALLGLFCALTLRLSAIRWHLSLPVFSGRDGR